MNAGTIHLRLVSPLLVVALSVLALCLPFISSAQTPAPSAEEMVRALTPQARTRSLGANARNLRPMLDLTIQFDFDSATIRAESHTPLRNLARALQDNRLAPFRFQVEGHTDAQGGAAYNDRLSEQRAQAVVRFLVAQGVAIERLHPEGKGFRELLDVADPKSPANRRVRIMTRR